ncbi:acyltransferase [Mucilaginibacter gotjawali]|nr:acyltransferase [Mucilaginibacter gotjawali]MBB3057502.1 maltose O-acetyltransferase [Mucilaginibacter gotjawali]
MGFNIAKGSYIFMGCTFDKTNDLSIGINSVINGKCRMDTRGGITIGENVSISSEVVILTADHDISTSDMSGRNKPVSIGNYVWVGTRAMILPGVSIGEGAVIAAGSIVTRNVNAFEVVAGIPAKKIGERPVNGAFTYTASYKRLFQ